MDFICRRQISSSPAGLLLLGGRTRQVTQDTASGMHPPKGWISFFVLGSENEESLKNYYFSPQVTKPQRDLAPPVNLAPHGQCKIPPPAAEMSLFSLRRTENEIRLRRMKSLRDEIHPLGGRNPFSRMRKWE